MRTHSPTSLARTSSTHASKPHASLVQARDSLVRLPPMMNIAQHMRPCEGCKRPHWSNVGHLYCFSCSQRHDVAGYGVEVTPIFFPDPDLVAVALPADCLCSADDFLQGPEFLQEPMVVQDYGEVPGSPTTVVSAQKYLSAQKRESRVSTRTAVGSCWENIDW